MERLTTCMFARQILILSNRIKTFKRLSTWRATLKPMPQLEEELPAVLMTGITISLRRQQHRLHAAQMVSSRRFRAKMVRSVDSMPTSRLQALLGIVMGLPSQLLMGKPITSPGVSISRLSPSFHHSGELSMQKSQL